MAAELALAKVTVLAKGKAMDSDRDAVATLAETTIVAVAAEKVEGMAISPMAISSEYIEHPR
jgi:hypothetical protein